MEINVSGCEHFYQYDQCKNTCHWFGTPCEWVDTKECTYKQLQQLKAENEGLQSLNDFNVQKIETLEAEIEKLEKADCKKCLEKGNKSELYCVKCVNRSILNTIKQAKEGGE